MPQVLALPVRIYHMFVFFLMTLIDPKAAKKGPGGTGAAKGSFGARLGSGGGGSSSGRSGGGGGGGGGKKPMGGMGSVNGAGDCPPMG